DDALAVQPDERAEEAILTDMGEERPELGLEEDHEEDHPYRFQAVDDPVQGVEAEPLRHDRDEHDDHEPHEHLGGARALDHGEEAVEEKRHDEDVDHVEEDLRLDRNHAVSTPSGDSRRSARRRAETVSRTSWVRKIRAHSAYAATVAPSPAARRPSGGSPPPSAPRKDFRESPT